MQQERNNNGSDDETLVKTDQLEASMTTTTNDDKDDDDDKKEPPILISDIIGNFGRFQLLVVIFSGLRAFSESYDELMLSMVFATDCPDDNSTDYTIDARHFSHPERNFTAAQIHKEAKAYTLCGTHWSAGPIQSCYFFGLMLGNLTWGYVADKFGRRRAYLVGHLIQALVGVASIFLSDVGLYVLCRFLTGFCSASRNVLYSVQMEMVGAKYRSYSTALDHLGSGLGIISTPFIARAAAANFRYVIGVSPMITLNLLPFAFLLPESAKWLMVKGRFDEAQNELLRAAKFNEIAITPALVEKIRQLAEQTQPDIGEPLADDESWRGRRSAYKIVMQDSVLLRDTVILCYTIFLAFMFYYVLTLNFAFVENLNVEANFITSGAGEWLSFILGAAMLRFFSRQTSMCMVLQLMSLSFIFQFLIDADIFPSLNTGLIVTLNNAIGTTAALLLILLLIVSQEVYPTLVRQMGSGFVNTVAELGATMAPIVIQVSRVLGMWRADVVSAMVCLVASFAVLFLSKTDNKELA